jgi:putative ABC transport system permease protein
MARSFNWLAQVSAITKLNLQTIPQRKGASVAAVFGIAGVVAVLVGVLSIAQGFRHALMASGAPENAIVLRSGADSEMMSGLDGDEVRVIADAPHIARSGEGPLASPELYVIINIPKRVTLTDANVPLRGVTMAAFQVHDQLVLQEGRHFQPGRNEVMVGTGAAREFAGLELGSTLQVGRQEWEVVGIFTAGGGISESEIWTDASVLQGAYQRGNTYQSVAVKLESPDAVEQFEEALMRDPRLNVKVVRQSDYYAQQSQAVYRLITGLGTLVASLMALGAAFGALNTMYTAISARMREIATLRALGFGAGPVVISVLTESLFLAFLGGALGGAFAYFLFDGFTTATMNFASFSQVAFAFRVTPSLLAQGVIYAALIGLVGGFFPAIRAARQPIAGALRGL